MKTRKLSIYFFSGTGNALKTSEWVAEVAENAGISYKVVSIDRMPQAATPDAGDGEMVGFVFPTHGFNLPWYMLKFIWRFPQSQNTGFFVINTRAGMKISRFIFLPGLSGIAWMLPVIILWFKGYSLKGLMSVDMPSNWISLHPGLKPKVVDSLSQRWEKKVKRFAEKLFANGKSFKTKLFISLPIDIAIIPISILYMLYARYFLSKTFLAATNCNLCRLCEENCPVKAIQIRDNRPYWTLQCESCMRCINICPQKAIQTSHSFAAVMIALTASLPVSYYLNVFFTKIFGISSPFFELFAFLSGLLVFVFLFYLLYKLLFYFIRFSWINKMFTYTSFTRFWRHYIARGVNMPVFKKYRQTENMSKSENESPIG